MLEAGHRPGFAKPEPPSHGQVRDALAVVGITALMLMGGGRASLQAASLAAGTWDPGHRLAILAPAVIYGGHANQYADLALAHEIDGDLGAAARWYRAAAETRPRNPNHPADLARVLGRDGQCGEALQSLRQALEVNDRASGRWAEPGLGKTQLHFVTDAVDGCEAAQGGGPESHQRPDRHVSALASRYP
jgi:tetratricopeptide (TPR) repeat protein